MTDDDLRTSARRVASGLLAAAADCRGVVLETPSALKVSRLLADLADRLGDADGRKAERAEILAALQALAERASAQQQDDQRCGCWRKALASGAASVAYEHAARAVAGRGA
jgi:hypothetical protein